MDKGAAKKDGGQLETACEKNRHIIRRSRELLATIDQRLSAANKKRGTRQSCRTSGRDHSLPCISAAHAGKLFPSRKPGIEPNKSSGQIVFIPSGCEQSNAYSFAAEIQASAPFFGAKACLI
jgi:hypothetical protein